ncbi:LptF/LptG family permease, partial [Candidatus Saganbacteria bacterium]|nr:LptF/LptG family permease [Candidatus Saganbacteria bacterium]
MFFKTIDRYIFKELLEPFLFGLGAFTAILASSMILFELVRAVVLHGMPLTAALQIFIYRLPGIVVYIFPMATLLAALLAFSRLSHDSEIIAFKASGISLFRLVVPALALGLIASVANLTFSEIVVPESNKAAKNLLLETSARRQPRLQKNVFVPELEQGALVRIFYAETMKGQTMRGVIVQEFTRGKLSQIINAEEAAWERQKNQWLFKNGTIYLIAETGEYKHLIKFKEQYVTIKYTPADFYVGDRNPDEMSIQQLRAFISLKEKMGVDVVDFNIQLNMKMAIPFASLVFALLGVPLGISPRRTSGSLGLGLSIIFNAFDMKIMASIAMIASLYHALNHAVFKGLLFLAAGAVVAAAHERDM